MISDCVNVLWVLRVPCLSCAVKLPTVCQKIPSAHYLLFQLLLHIWLFSNRGYMLLRFIFDYRGQLRDSYTIITKGANNHWCWRTQQSFVYISHYFSFCNALPKLHRIFACYPEHKHPQPGSEIQQGVCKCMTPGASLSIALLWCARGIKQKWDAGRFYLLSCIWSGLRDRKKMHTSPYSLMEYSCTFPAFVKQMINE